MIKKSIFGKSDQVMINNKLTTAPKIIIKSETNTPGKNQPPLVPLIL